MLALLTLLCGRAEVQTSKMELLEKIIKRFKDTNYFYNNLHLRHLAGFEYTSEEYLFRKYPEI